MAVYVYDTNIMEHPNVRLEEPAVVGQVIAFGTRNRVVEIKLIKDGTIYCDFVKVNNIV